MKISFDKYQGTGNDFVMIDNRDQAFSHEDLNTVSFLCDRRFGVGADGVILIEDHSAYDFEMVYFNPDGSQSLCGNGSRCAVKYAEALGIISGSTRFLAIDGPHEASIAGALVDLKMANVTNVQSIGEDRLIDTGSPHYLRYVDKTQEIDPVLIGREVRYSERFAKEGVNVNFLEEVSSAELNIRTYERGVENETLSCGTGCTAAAIAHGIKTGAKDIKLNAQGGQLSVRFERHGNEFKEIFLKGPAEKVYSGQIVV